MGQKQHHRHTHRLAESEIQTDSSLHCFRWPETGYSRACVPHTPYLSGLRLLLRAEEALKAV